MTLQEIQKFIDLNLRRKDGRLSPMKPDIWWESNGFSEYKKYIFDVTSNIDIICWPQRIWHILNGLLENMKCETTSCKNNAIWSTNTSSYQKTCSKQCAATSDVKLKRFEETCISRFGTTCPAKNKDVMAKATKTNLKKFGVKYTVQSDIVRQKSKDTMIVRYGVDNPAKDPEIYKKIISTNRDRYGADHPLQCKEVLDKRTDTNNLIYGGPSPTNNNIVRQKQVDTMVERYGVENWKYINISPDLVDILTNKEKFIRFVTGKYMSDILAETGLEVSTLYKIIAKYECNDILLKEYTRSSHERKMEYFLKSHGINFQTSNREIVKPKELDFYIPEHNLAIELCGVYYHSDSMGKDKSYHYNKWKQCKDIGITLLTYFDDELEKSNSVIESKILYMCGKHTGERLGARQLTIGELSIAAEREFLDKNHIQGFLKNRNHSIGAYYGDKLVAVMCITDRKFHKEITRFAVDINYIVSGAFSKMLQWHVRAVNYAGDIVSFSDNCHGAGSLYESAGFERVGDVLPTYSYTNAGRPRENKQNYMKNKIAKKFNINTDNKTEFELMNELGYSKVWDCGKIKWKITITKGFNDGKTV